MGECWTYSISVLPKLPLKIVPVILTKLQFTGANRTTHFYRIRENQPLRIVKLITLTALYSVSKEHEKNVAIMRCTNSTNCLQSEIYFNKIQYV